MFKRYCWILVVLFLLGCTAELSEPVAQSTPLPTETATSTATVPPVASMTATLTTTPTELPPTATFVPTSSIHNSMTMTPTPGPRPSQTPPPMLTEYAAFDVVPPPAGLLYVDPEGQHFLVDANGDSQPIGQPGAAISPDGLYQFGRLSATELATGATITFYEDGGFIREWWPENPDWIVLALFPDSEWNCYGACGTPVLARVDGSELLPLAEISLERQLSGPVGTDPNGSAIAYSIGQDAFIFDFENGVVELDLNSFSLAAESWLSHPSFAPAGDRIAWALHGPGTEADPQANSGILMTTLSGEYIASLTGYEMAGLDGAYDAPAWSNDGEMIAFQAVSEREQIWGTFWTESTLDRSVDGESGFYPAFVTDWLIVQDFDQSPPAYVAHGPLDTFNYHVNLIEITRAMPHPWEDAAGQKFYLPNSEGVLFAIDQTSLDVSLIDIPVGSRIVSWLK